jgi:hypothetical protein
MSRASLRPLIAVSLPFVLMPLLLWAAHRFAMPKAEPAASYAVHDDHPEEKVTFAADPYDSPEKTRIFRTDYRRHGLLPLFLVVANHGSEPLRLSRMSVQLVTGSRTKLEPIEEDDLLRRLSDSSDLRKQSSGTPGMGVPFPLPKKVKGLVSKEAIEEFESASFQAHAVEPGAQQCGFVFFDIAGIDAPLAGATLYVNGVRDNRGQELMFFELPLGKYAEKTAGGGN